MSERLLRAAKAVTKQWVTPNWKMTESTNKLIGDLSAAIVDAESRQNAAQNPGYTVTISKSHDGGWIAAHPQLQGCIADGKTPEEALELLHVSRALWIESRTACGLEVPQPAYPADEKR